MLLPVTCPLCGGVGAAPCGACIDRLRPAGARPAPPGLDALWCLVDYDPVGAQLVAALKYHNARRLVPWLARALAELVPADIDAVTWAPTTGAHRRRRGYDQAAVLARATAGRCGLPAPRLIRRLDRRSQTGRARHERLVGPRFRARAGRIPDVVLVIDDVVTTGATLVASADALRRAGGRRVVGLTVAHTPAGRLHSSSENRQVRCTLPRPSRVRSAKSPTREEPYGRHDQQP